VKQNINRRYAFYLGVMSIIVITIVLLPFLWLVIREGNLLRTEIERTERSVYEESQGRTHFNIAEYLSSNLFVHAYQLDIEGINRLINDIKKALPILSFVVADETGTILTDGSRKNELYGTRLNIPVERLTENTIIAENVSVGRKITFAIRAGNHTAGYGEIVFSDEPLKSAIRKHDAVVARTWNEFKSGMLRLSMVGMLIILVIAVCLSIFFSRTLSKPLLKLQDAANRVAQGDLEHRVAIDSGDEIGELAASFNRMVSDLRLSTVRLQEANSKLKALDQLKSDFISVVSHELRTPITSIKAFAELILIKPNMEADRKAKFLSVINSESDRLARLINDILDLTKIEAGKLSWNITALSIDDVIETSITTFQPLADNKQLTLTAAGEPSLPNIFGDRDRLIQVVTNLLSNAVKYTPPGGKIEVAMHEERIPRHQVVITVADTGSGIPADYLQHIFEKFHRSDDFVADTTEGTGLGLAIARLIVEYHGGSISVESTVGSGSTFTVSLPVETALTAEGAQQSAVARL